MKTIRQRWASERNLSYGSLIGIKIRLRQLMHYRCMLPHEAALIAEAEYLIEKATKDYKTWNQRSREIYLSGELHERNSNPMA